MANPAVMRVKEGRVECIARNVTAGSINRSKKNKENMKFLITYRTTGATKPTYSTMTSEGVQIFTDSEQEIIDSSSAIDVYLSCTDGTGSATSWGEVIVWV